jgi:glyoxylase-like metal-dependent hydrolase (beta-lactamase superfamily II)
LEIKDLRNKFFQAKPSRVTKIVENDCELEPGLRTFGLAGHYFNMIGVESPDNVLFIADSVFGEAVLEKYKIPFIYDVRAFKQTLEKLKTSRALYYVPSHGPIEKNIHPIAEKNLELVDRLEEQLTAIVEREKSFDGILKELCDAFDIELNAGQYALVGSTLRSCLSYLYDEKKIAYRFVENVMVWTRTTRTGPDTLHS